MVNIYIIMIYMPYAFNLLKELRLQRNAFPKVFLQNSGRKAIILNLLFKQIKNVQWKNYIFLWVQNNHWHNKWTKHRVKEIIYLYLLQVGSLLKEATSFIFKVGFSNCIAVTKFETKWASENKTHQIPK